MHYGVESVDFTLDDTGNPISTDEGKSEPTTFPWNSITHPLATLYSPAPCIRIGSQTSVAVVNVTTSGRTIWPLKRSWMNFSTSSKSLSRSPGFII